MQAVYPVTCLHLSINTTCAGFSFTAASAKVNQPPRSTSGTLIILPERGGHSTRILLLTSFNGSRSPQQAKAAISLPLLNRQVPRLLSSPLSSIPVSSLNSRRAAISGSSSSECSPFGIDQAPASLLRQNGPPGWTRKNSSCGFRRYRRTPALFVLRFIFFFRP